ncbi:hypothetical protein [Edaphobacter bradus]|uniref:hypothetical protein n=1 Tax=Edaphobacter bradus TaxID=2259016 RepID=UPI0021DFC64D|nr:hypothetical protein [Edaphobacter bradus]
MSFRSAAEESAFQLHDGVISAHDGVILSEAARAAPWFLLRYLLQLLIAEASDSAQPCVAFFAGRTGLKHTALIAQKAEVIIDGRCASTIQVLKREARCALNLEPEVHVGGTDTLRGPMQLLLPAQLRK